MRPPHTTREQNLRLAMLVAAIVDSDVRDSLEPSDFMGEEMKVFECIKSPAKGLGALDNWLHCQLGVDRKNGEKVLDACRRQLAHDAVLAGIERQGREGKHEALMIRFHEAVTEKREGRNQQ